MNSLTASQPWSLRHLSRDLTASQPSPNGTSAVSLRHLSRCTLRHLNRGATAEMPFKEGFSGGIRARGDSTATTLQVRLRRSDQQASTRLRRGTSVRVVVHLSQRLKGSSGLRAESKDKSKSSTNTNTGMVLWRCL